MHYLVGSYDHNAGIGTAIAINSSNVRSHGRGLQVNPNISEGDIVNFANYRKDIAPSPGDIFRMNPTHSFVTRMENDYYCSAEIREDCGFVSVD